MFASTRETDVDVDGLEVFDVFSGGGGFSCGATAAGCKVVFACDADEESILTHQLNHPGAKHMCARLPAELPLPTDGRPFHLHGSPPCQKFSSINTKNRKEGDRDGAANLVEWYLETALASQATSWSMEQVPSPSVIELCDRVRRQHPGRMAYRVFRMEDLGVPQTRRRLIAGTPWLVARLARLCGKHRHRSMREVLPNQNASHIRTTLQWVRKVARKDCKVGESKFVYTRAPITPEAHNVRPTTRPAPTILTSGDLRWTWWVDGRVNYRRISVRESATLQTFPSHYHLPINKVQAYRQIGNAVPPIVAELMMRGESRPLSPSLRRPPGPIGV